MQGILTMLPKVNRELLATYLDGFKKEGWVYKRSAILRQYRKRWLVLTPAGALYTFKTERVYNSPTEEVFTSVCGYTVTTL